MHISSYLSTPYSISEDEKNFRTASIALHDGDTDSKLELSSPTRDMEHLEKGDAAKEDFEKAIHQQRAEVNLIDWNGPDDPECPQNWPAWIRYCHVVPPALISFAAWVFRP